MNVPHKVLEKEQEFMGYTIPEVCGILTFQEIKMMITFNYRTQ
jgi:hypothetical protein